MYKWIILVGSFIVYMFDALEIFVLSLALPAISDHFDISATQAGLLATATLLGMGIGGPVMGAVADARGRRFALIICLVIFITFTSLVSVVPSFSLFLVLRFIAGTGLGGVWSTISALVVEAWPKKNRGLAVTFVLSSYPIGGLVGSQLSRIMLPNWREMFLAAGLGAIIALLIVIVLFRESEAWQQARAARADRAIITEKHGTASLREIFTTRYLRTTIVASMVSAFAFVAFYGSSTWLPSYLENERQLDAQTVGTFMTWLNLGMFVGYLVFGMISDRFGKRFALFFALIGAGILMPIYGLVTNHTALLLLGPAYAFFMTFAGLFGPYLSGIYPTHVRATGAGFCFNLGRGVSAFAPFLFGALATIASLSAGLVISGVMFLCGAALILLLPKDSPPPRDNGREDDDGNGDGNQQEGSSIPLPTGTA